MIIEERFELSAPPAAVADGLLDVVTVSQCVPGVSAVRETADGSFEAVLQMQVGPIRAAFAGELVVDRSAAPGTIRATGSGVDRASGSAGTIHVEATLRETPHGTEVTTIADVSLRGRLGQFGAGVIRATSSELLRQFIGCFEASLGTVAVPDVTDREQAVGVPPPGPPARRLTLWHLIRAMLLGALRQLTGGLRARRGRRAREGA